LLILLDKISDVNMIILLSFWSQMADVIFTKN